MMISAEQLDRLIKEAEDRGRRAGPTPNPEYVYDDVDLICNAPSRADAAGYIADVKREAAVSERERIIRTLEAEAKERESLGLADEAHALRYTVTLLRG